MRVKVPHLSLALLLWACGDRASLGEAPERQQPAKDVYAEVATTTRPAARPAAMADGASARDDGAANLPLPGATDVIPNLVIRSGTAALQVDSLDRSIILVRALARHVGGFVGASATETGKGQPHSATLEIRMPAEHFDETLDGLRAIGSIEAVNVTAEDVGEEYVDVQARMMNDRRLEARLIDLLARRTGKLTDVLDVERELARVREETERYEGRLRYLQSRAAVSTLNLTVHEAIPVVDQRSPGVVSEAVRDAWRNFIAVVALLIQSLGVVIPLAFCALAGWVLVRRFKRPPPASQAA